jgi:hypothetical protein
MSCTVERFVYQYDLNQQSRELECDSLEEALKVACGHLEWARASPKAIWRRGKMVMNLNEISNEWMQRHYSKLGHPQPDDPNE